MTSFTVSTQSQGPAGAGAHREGWRPFAGFLAITFAITWGLGVLAIAWPAFADVAMTYALPVAVAAPSVAALIVIARHRGRAGLAAWWCSLTRWRVSWRYWAVPLLAVPAVGIASRAIESGAGGRAFDLTWTVPLAIVAAIPVTLVTDPGWTEEPGWRGFALPWLLERLGWRASALVLGSITTVWHIPAWFVSGTAQEGFVFWAFVLFHVSNAVIMSALFVRTRSVLVAGIAMHLMTNLIASPVVGAGLAWAGGLLGAVALVMMMVVRSDRPQSA